MQLNIYAIFRIKMNENDRNKSVEVLINEIK